MSGVGTVLSGDGCPQLGEGFAEIVRPRPALIQSQDEPPPAADEKGGHMEDPVAHGLRLGLGSSAPSKQVTWLQANRAPAMRLVATQVSLRTKE